MTRSKWREALDDLEYWQELGELLGWTVLGWTYRHGVTYLCDGQTIQMNGAQRDATLAKLQGRATPPDGVQPDGHRIVHVAACEACYPPGDAASNPAPPTRPDPSKSEESGWLQSWRVSEPSHDPSES